MAKNGHSGLFRPQDVPRGDAEMFLDYKTFKIEILGIFGPLGVPPYRPLGYTKMAEKWLKMAILPILDPRTRLASIRRCF